VSGLLTLAGEKKEARERAFVESLECVARPSPHFSSGMPGRERKQQPGEPASLRGRGHHRELELTNKRLIERVQD